jgi:tRNA A37 threonylcarbamoyladenosine dehydratase
MQMQDTPDFARRFGGVSRLYGTLGLQKLQAAHICVIGIGGVGSWAAEALARNAVGTMTLIDLDNIAESNVNRQIHAVEGAFGRAKVSAMQSRIKAINPACQVHVIEDFVTPENISTLLSQRVDMVVDCIDDAKAKIALAAFCKRQQQPMVMVGSAGGRLDPTRIQMDDLAYVTGDRLLAKVRNQLRRDFSFPKASNTKKSAKFGIAAIFSDEPALKPLQESAGECEVNPSITGLNCAGYGSSVCVTAPFGFVAAQYALNHILKT